jgi:hypothetical protein
MSPQELKTLCDSLNNAYGKGGIAKLARLVPRHPRTVGKMIGGKVAIPPLVASRVRLVVARELRKGAKVARKPHAKVSSREAKISLAP